MYNIEFLKELIDLEKEYRKKYSGIEDASAKDRYYIDKKIFPSWWFLYEDATLKYKILKKALGNDKRLEELEEVQVINKYELIKNI